MSYQTPKKSHIPTYLKVNKENVPPLPTLPDQASPPPGQAVATPSNWTFVPQESMADGSPPSGAHLPIPRGVVWRARPLDLDLDLETPPRLNFSRYDKAYQHLMQIAQKPGQKAVTIPGALKEQSRPVLPFHFQLEAQEPGPLNHLVLPIRQPVQPVQPAQANSAGPFAWPGKMPSEEKFYWPMDNIHGVVDSPPAEQSSAAARLGQLSGHLQHPRPVLVSESDAPSKVALGFSPEYHGDPNLPRNRSANIPDELNCSLFLVNLPPDLTTHRLIAAIHATGPTGRIYATHINAPEPDRKHYGCAAKVIFFELSAAKAFYRACEERGFTVDGYAVRVMWNRIKTAQQEHARSTTRVLLIGGDPKFVNPDTLTEYFGTKLQFQVDCIITHSDGLKGDKTDAVVEFRFGSFRCQAEAAKMALVREHPEVRCFFHCDPCDPDHWTPPPGTKIPIAAPVAPAVPLRCPIAPPPGGPQLRNAGFRAGARLFPRLPVVHEDVEDQNASNRSALRHHPVNWCG
jgi:hypothetical protein